MRSRSRSGPVDAAEVGRTRRAGQWSSDMPPRTSRSEESSSDGGWSQMSTRPGSDTCSTDGAVGSPTHRLSYARIADTCTHPATDKLPDIAGRLPPWQSRTETGGAFWGMTVGARLHTTYWGLLKQPDNQMLSRLQLPKSSFWPRSVPWGADCCPTTARPSPVARAGRRATPELERDDRSTPTSHGRRTTAAAAAPPDWKVTSRRWPSTAGT